MLEWLPVTRSVELLNTFSEIHTMTTSYYKRRARWRKRLKRVLPLLATAGQWKFKVLTIKLQSLPTHLERFSATPQTLEEKQSQQRVRGFCLLQFWKSEWLIGNQERNFCRISTVIFYNIQRNIGRKNSPQHCLHGSIKNGHRENRTGFELAFLRVKIVLWINTWGNFRLFISSWICSICFKFLY